MENRFDHKDFERFVKQNADQYRMFPSEKVWEGIHNTLHTRNRWYGIGLSLLILTTAVVSWVMFSNSSKHKPIISSLPPVSAIPAIKEQKAPAPVAITPVASDAKTSFVTSVSKFQQEIFVDDYKTEAPVMAVTSGSIASLNQPGGNTVTNFLIDNSSDYPVVKASTVPRQSVVPKENPVPVIITKTTEPSSPVLADSQPDLPAVEESVQKSNEYASPIPFTIESVINSFKYIRKKNKISIQAFITPTISYRELKENKPVVEAARNATLSVPNASYAADVNTVVTHKPDIGLQLGFTAGYPINNRVRVIGGLQFNISKYDIRAYDHTPEMTTIALSTAAGGTNTFSALSNYRNVGTGNKENWLHNLYFSASAPIGLEVRLAGNRKNYFGISATAQPTYMLSNDAYLISTDYKNYAEVPSQITRKWNMNAGFEMFAGVSTGHLRWRVGPQVRYQTKSSFQEKYPIQEHLFDFGLKMGIMLK